MYLVELNAGFQILWVMKRNQRKSVCLEFRLKRLRRVHFDAVACENCIGVGYDVNRLPSLMWMMVEAGLLPDIRLI